MGSFCFGQSKQRVPQEAPQASKVQNVDVVKIKLKQARDRIRNFINLKNRDLIEIDKKIAEKVPSFKQTGNKKQLVPLLTAKKSLEKIIESGQVRLKLVNNKVDEVQMQKLNADTISVLDESNKYIQEIQQDLEKKDWRNVLDEAKNKYELEWPDDSEQVQDDPAFQKMWDELGGNKIAQKNIPKKNVQVNIENNNQRQVEKEFA